MELWYLSYLLPIAMLVIMSAFFSASETAIFSMSVPKVRALVHKNIQDANVLEELKIKPKRVLIAILVGNNIVNISASAIATVFFMKMLGAIGAGVAAVTMTAVLITFGEILPKSYAAHHAEKISLKVSRAIVFLIKLLTPVNWLFLKFMKFSGQGESAVGRQEELKALVTMSVEEGEMEKAEKELIENVLQFTDITVEEVMTTRKDMITIDGNIPLNRAIRLMLLREYSRYPVYYKEKDNIIGIVHIKDALLVYNKRKQHQNLKTISSEPIFVPEHQPLSDLMKEFQDKRMHMAIVVNDHGEIVGLVTLEDILEELVGEIIDESDVTKTMIKRIDKNTVMIHGMTELKDLQRFIHLRLTGKKTDTINAIILKKLKKIPKEGDTFNIEGNEIEIIESTPKQVIKLKLTRTYNL